MASKFPTKAIDIHNELVRYLGEHILKTDIPELKNLFRYNPLTPVNIDSIETISDLFVYLMKHDKIHVGDYKLFVAQLERTHQNLVTYVKDAEKEIKKIVNGEIIRNMREAQSRPKTDEEEIVYDRLSPQVETDEPPDEHPSSTDSGAKRKPDGAAIPIKKQIGNISLKNCTNVQVGDRNVMAINRSGKRPPKEEMMEDNIPAIHDAPSVELTAQQQAVLDSGKLVDDRKLRVLATHIGKQWRKIFRKLEIPEAEIDQLHIDFNEQGIRTVIFHGLQRWKQKNARNATVGKLVKVLYDVTKNKEFIDSMNQP